MKIRSITCFWDPTLKVGPLQIPAELSAFRVEAVRRFQDAGMEVQTTRLATVDFLRYLDGHKGLKVLLQQLQDLESRAKATGFEYLSVGSVRPEDGEEWYDFIPNLLAGTRNTFFSGVMADRGVMFPLFARKCARVIRACREIEPEGFANLRFAALAQVQPGAPFFPAASHMGGGPAFALAMESADEAVKAFDRAADLAEARRLLLDELNEKSAAMEVIADQLEREFGINFGGFDFSLAPFPTDDISLGAAMEKLGVPRLGRIGSLSAAAFVADTLDLGSWKRAGFNGLMLPVLEDSRLALRSSEGALTLRDLLLFSAMCGTGLDTVPLPGDASEDALTALLLDVAALATRLGKPLTARLMPIPGRRAGEETKFSFGFFANGRVMDLEETSVGGLLAAAGVVDVKPRHVRRGGGG